MVYPEGHPYRHRTIGTEDLDQEMDRDELMRFHGKHFRPDQTIVAVAGGLEVDQGWS